MPLRHYSIRNKKVSCSALYREAMTSTFGARTWRSWFLIRTTFLLLTPTRIGGETLQGYLFIA